MENPEASLYSQAWKSYRWRWIHFLGTWLGFPTALAVCLAATHGRMPPERVGEVLGFVWWVVCLYTGIRLYWWKCPSCHSPFHIRGGFGNFLSRRCLNCGLRKWATQPDRFVIHDD